VTAPRLDDVPLNTATSLVREGYAAWIATTGLADRSKDTYTERVDDFLRWLADSGDDQHTAALVDPRARDWAVRDYRRHLLTERKTAESTARLAMVAIESFYTWLGLGAPDAPKVTATRRRTAPRALGEADQRKLLRSAEARGARDHALLALAMDTGLREAELASLDTDDVVVTARTGRVRVVGKGTRGRTVPLPARTRPLITAWREVRGQMPGSEATPALFLARGGRRISVRTIDHVIRTTGRQVGLEISPRTLRHTFATNLVRGGQDLVVVAELLGHSRVETVRVYTNPQELHQTGENPQVD
jgi:integrase/recombinase XerC